MEFVYKGFHEFITQTKNLEGSTSIKKHPTDNAVVERWNKTFKLERLKDTDRDISYEFLATIETT